MTALHAQVPLTLHDPSQSVLKAAHTRLAGLLERDVAKTRISKDAAGEALDRVRLVPGDAGSLVAEDVDLVVEAIPEVPALKLSLFETLGARLPKESVLGSNTSSISLTKLAAAAGKGAEGSASRVIG